MRTLLAPPFLNIYLHEGPMPVLEMEWLGYAPSADFRAALVQALELSRQHHARLGNPLTIEVAYTRTMPTLHFAVQRFAGLAQARAWASNS